MRLAALLGCTLAELGRRMGAAEFGLWLAMMNEEGIGPLAEQQRWAMLMAALHNGPLVRRDKRHWRAADFMPEPWAEPHAPPAAAPPVTTASLRAFVQSLKQQHAASAARGH